MTKVQEAEAELENIIKSLGALKGTKYTAEQVEKLQEKLHAIDEKWKDGAIKEEDGSIAGGQAALSDLINEAHDVASDLLSELEDE
ncbi:hypothetical protein HK104_010485 [Borealophlyctis nickersoniae]|nr:hypothetical protein HK104_010485 [Borealophlyctis nickersoniae]